MTKLGKGTATIFIVIGFIVTALTGLNGNLIAMGGWLMATVLVIAICVNAEDHAEQLQIVRPDLKAYYWDGWRWAERRGPDSIADQKGEPLLNVDEKTIDWNRAALQIVKEERRN
jgi:hypothetical protein